jgi:hypothetical protein
MSVLYVVEFPDVGGLLHHVTVKWYASEGILSLTEAF